MKFINMTPHKIVLNNGTSFEPCGKLAEAKQTFGDFVDGISQSKIGDLKIPKFKKGVIIIASMPVAQAAAAIGRTDVVAPATRHNLTRRDEKGHIVSVPGFLRF